MNDVAFQAIYADWLLADDAAQVSPVAQAAFAAIDPARLAVHRNTFVVTLVDALAESYPTCLALFGADCFRAAARAFVLAQPPQSPVVSEYVLAFPAFVARWSPLAAMSFLADVAALEAARIRAFHAADATPLEAAAFAALVADPARLATTRVRLHPAAEWRRFASPAQALWQAHQAGEGDAPDVAVIDLSAIDVALGQDVLVSRPRFEVEVTVLPAGAIPFLDALRDGVALADAFALALGADDADAAALFGLLVARELVVAFDNTSTS